MRRILRRDNVLVDRCEKGAEDAGPCDAQELALGLIYTMGSWSNQFARLPVGIFLDRCGPRITVAASSLAMAAGSIIFGLTSELPGLVAGFLLLGAGGAGVQLAVQNTSSLFPQRRSMAMACLSGAFQFGTLVYLLFEVVHRDLGASRSTLLLAHAGVAILVLVAGLFIWPDIPFSLVGQGDAHARGRVLRDGVEVPPKVDTEKRGHLPEEDRELTHAAERAGAVGHDDRSGRIDGAESQLPPLRERSFVGQVRSAEYLLMLCFFSINMLPAQFTVGTMGTQLELKGDDSGDALRVYSAIFAISAVATPFAGLGIDKYGFPLAMLIVNTMLGVSYAVLIVPALEVQLVAYVLYSVGRVCLWAIMFSFVGAVFGFVHYGKLAGGALAFGAFLSLLQYAALELTLGPFEGNFTFVNTVWCALCASMYLVIFLVHRRLPGPGGTTGAARNPPAGGSSCTPSWTHPTGSTHSADNNSPDAGLPLAAT